MVRRSPRAIATLATAWVLGARHGGSSAAGHATDWVFQVNPPEELELRPQPSSANDKTGAAVAIGGWGGDVAVIGVPGRNQALAFVRTECSWGGSARGCWAPSGVLGTGTINADAKLGEALSLSMDGVTVLVGASGRNLGSGASQVVAAGTAYTFSYERSQWRSDATLLPNDVRAGDFFGRAVALSADASIAVIGAPGRDVTTTAGTTHIDCGTAYAFIRSQGAGGWSRATEIKIAPDDLQAGDNFGSSVAVLSSMTGWIVAVGAPVQSADAGAVYIYWIPKVNPSGWGLRQKVAGPTQTELLSRFGNALSFAAEPYAATEESEGEWLLAIGAVGYSTSFFAPSAGAVHLFRASFGWPETPGSTWNNSATLTAEADASASDAFGISVAVSADSTAVVVGANKFDRRVAIAQPPYLELTANTGAAFLFVRNSSSPMEWVRQIDLLPTTALTNGDYGSAVAISANASVILVGAKSTDLEIDCSVPGASADCHLTQFDSSGHGVVYAHSNACSRVSINFSSDRGPDGVAWSGGEPCFETTGRVCLFQCGQGFISSNSAARARASAVSRERVSHAPHQWAAIRCHEGRNFMARWDKATCTEVACPAHSHAEPLLTQPTGLETRGQWQGKRCVCELGYAGRIDWDLSLARWLGECTPLACAPLAINHSSTSTSHGQPCEAVTGARCSYRCDISYRAVGTHTAQGSAVCLPDGTFADAACEVVHCPLHGSLVLPQRDRCQCDSGWSGNVLWLPDQAIWSESCVGNWIEAERVRSVVLNVVVLLTAMAALGMSLRWCRHKYLELGSRSINSNKEEDGVSSKRTLHSWCTSVLKRMQGFRRSRPVSYAIESTLSNKQKAKAQPVATLAKDVTCVSPAATADSDYREAEPHSRSVRTNVGYAVNNLGTSAIYSAKVQIQDSTRRNMPLVLPPLAAVNDAKPPATRSSDMSLSKTQSQAVKYQQTNPSITPVLASRVGQRTSIGRPNSGWRSRVSSSTGAIYWQGPNGQVSWRVPTYLAHNSA